MTHTTRSTPTHSRRRLWLLAAVLVAVTAVAAGAAFARETRHTDPVPSGAAPSTAAAATDSAGLTVATDRVVKKRLLAALPRPPQLLILGGSRATRFEPAYLQRLTGLRGFNLALQNGRPEDAWAFLNDQRRRHPEVRLRVVWFTHVEAFREQGLNATLAQDPDLSRWFPESLLEEARADLPTRPEDVPPARDLQRSTYGPDGLLLSNRYDQREAKGYSLDRALSWSIDTVSERYRTTTPALFPRSVRYFEKTVRLLNEDGTTPVVVLMPLHPRLLRAVRDLGWQRRHDEVRAWLQVLQRRNDLVVLDFSDLATVHGDPLAYYDGFHVKTANARRILREVVRRAPASFR